MSNHNAHKPGYKHTPLGWIPEEWEVKEFGNVVLKSQYGLSVASVNGGKHRIIGMKNIQDGKLVINNCATVSISDDEYEKYRLHKDDFLFNRTNSYDLVGKSVLVEEDIDAVFASYLVRFKIDKQKVEPKFLFYYFNTSRSDKELKAIATKAISQANINPTVLQDVFELVLPEISEQYRIATILSAWDDAVTQIQQLIAKLQQRNKSLMQELLRSKNNWTNLHLGDVLTRIANGITYDAESKVGKPVTRIETISKGEIDFYKVGYCDEKNINSYRMQTGDILYSHINSLDHIGKVAFYNGEYELYHGMNLLLLRTNETVLSKFLYYWFRSDHGRKQSKSFAKKAVNQASISSTEVKSFKLTIPRKEEQLKIVEVLDAAVSEVKLYEDKLAALQLQKKGLTEKLLTGEVRVKV